MEDIQITNNRFEVNLETIVKEAISKLESDTKVKIKSYVINNDKVILVTDGNDDNTLVLKDRLGVEEKNVLSEDKAVTKLKRTLAKVLDTKWKNSYDLKLKSIEDNDPELVHISLEVNLDTIPYPIRVSYHLGNDGYISISYSVFGDIEKDERWSSTSITHTTLLEKLAKIEHYYSVRHLEY